MAKNDTSDRLEVDALLDETRAERQGRSLGEPVRDLMDEGPGEPTVPSTQIIPSKRMGRPSLASLPKHELLSTESIDELLADERGD